MAFTVSGGALNSTHSFTLIHGATGGETSDTSAIQKEGISNTQSNILAGMQCPVQAEIYNRNLT